MLQARTAAAIGAAVLAAPQFGNREMVRNIADKFHHLNFKPSQLRALVDELCQFDTSAHEDAQKRVDERCAAWLHANDGSPEEFVLRPARDERADGRQLCKVLRGAGALHRGGDGAGSRGAPGHGARGVGGAGRHLCEQVYLAADRHP